MSSQRPQTHKVNCGHIYEKFNQFGNGLPDCLTVSILCHEDCLFLHFPGLRVVGHHQFHNQKITNKGRQPCKWTNKLFSNLVFPRKRSGSSVSSSRSTLINIQRAKFTTAPSASTVQTYLVWPAQSRLVYHHWCSTK